MSMFASSNPGGGLFGNTNTNAQANQSNTNRTGGGLFGNLGSTSTSTPAQPSLFGSTNTAQQSGTGSSLFGNTNTGGATGGGLFGGASSTTQPSSGEGLFGNTSTSTNPQQPASGGLFSSAASTQPTSGGLFGNTTAQSQPTGSLFGNANTSQQQSGSGLFGNTTTSSQPNTGGLFGNTTSNTQPSSGSLFGNTGTSTQLGGGLFGNTTSSAQPSGGGIFGNTPGQNTTSTGTGSSLFGGTFGGSLFGNTQNASVGTGGGLFGNTQSRPTGSLFGQTQTQPAPQQQSTLFGGSTLGQSTLGQPALGSSLLGGSILGSSSLGGSLLSSKPVVSSAQPADPQSQFIALQQRIEAIVAAWNPNSPDCRFQHFFYNLVDRNQIHLYGRPPNATNEALWQKAVHENPDPSCLVPALAVGFDDLQKRVEAQTQQVAAHQENVKELRTRIENLARRHELSNSSRIHRAAAVQAQITHQVLKLVRHLHLLIPTLRSSSIRPEEEALRAALEDIDTAIRRPGGLGRLKGKLNELWALIGAVNAARERDGKARADGSVGWAVVDEDGLNQIAQILMEQQAGLEHLTRILQRDLKDLAVVQGVGVKSEDETEQQTDFLLSSTSTLRASALR
ncbi:hypothetical protein NEOLEDRAFT_1155984 [Neolentinus lepideus HHB14362 ss-1]|uniref:Nucleoporin Nup54 alpha-helical domain-containing protein n=1 Tax=Neolentinus lepideus HHB14362 ss-1 TaxID=1314782 RepID=A0A165T433_9AGAM|nr:hypothetical protein NEOLEDRAFT_1155984 [Neolentinus lepideus HHB14362 ss-1]